MLKRAREQARVFLQHHNKGHTALTKPNGVSVLSLGAAK